MEIMGVVSERLQANTDTIKHDMINWLTKLRKQLLEANGGHTEADLQRELSRDVYKRQLQGRGRLSLRPKSVAWGYGKGRRQYTTSSSFPWTEI